MILRSCLKCEFHEVRQTDDGKMSHCTKENCWARFSKCVSMRALDRFLDEERMDSARRFSALEHVYPRE